MRSPTKRAKTIQACTSCRKHKTRCEILDPSESPVRCHRCKVLSIACSYEQTQVPAAPRPPEPNQPSPRSSKSAAVPGIRFDGSGERLWSFPIPEGQNLDWSAPMQAIHHLTTLPSTSLNPPEFVNNDLSLSMILPESRIDRLIELFHAQYTPWLNFQPIRNSKNPLVDIACSAVAARHLDGPAGTEVRLRLQTLTRDSLAQMVFIPRPPDSLEAIQCLLILSLWGPFGAVTESNGWDARFLISAAVRMAINLDLDRASAVVDDMRKLANPDVANLAEASERARLWIALTNVESMLCLGTGHAPSSRRTPGDYVLIQFPSALTGGTDLRHVRLGLMARQFELFEEAAAMRLHPGIDKEEWSHQIKGVLERMKNGRRLLMPLPVVLDSEQSYFHAIHIYLCIPRLLVLYHAFWEARASLPQIPLGQPWHDRFMPHAGGEALLGMWGRDMIQSSEALLVYALSTPTQTLCTAPDTLFNMVVLAAGYVVGAKFLMRRMSGRALLGASDRLLAKTAAHLHRAACGAGHAAQRCALLVQRMIAKWEARDDHDAAPTSYPTPPADFNFLQPGEEPALPVVSPTPPPPQEPVPEGSLFADVEFMFLNTMLADDTAFWDLLAEDQLRW
ncbi:hypothetical protein DFH07DRAFT_1008489 [Mycena maculata]|uniref:Zn(2)-C6 fungal-type domain-containing protein n=1 Tax=Mycena maculata TaxID=230809 RepID=A0AAD7HH47_9AGAR|nr:hypothetical protein DFH07DRAFT_1008489 [Mycena maculata]